jgi:hypothetical protein
MVLLKGGHILMATFAKVNTIKRFKYKFVE